MTCVISLLVGEMSGRTERGTVVRPAVSRFVNRLAGLLAFILAFNLAPATAQDAWLRGEWCSDDERMIVERAGPGFNEHTVCKWVGKRPAGERVDTQIACENVYDHDVRTDEGVMRFRAVKTGPRSVSVRVGSGGAMAYAKC